jgi:predicted type IV restriction endonuclease
MAVYQEKARTRIKGALRKFSGILSKARAANSNEADTRTIVSAVISEMLGWDPFEHLTAEYRIKGNYADYMLRDEANTHWAVIEVKSVGTKLSAKHLYQATSYAANEGIEWVILTNADEWILYRVIFNKPITQDEVLRVSITDADMKPAQKTDLFYLLSHEAPRKSELDAYYKRKTALCGSNLASAMLSPAVMQALRSEMRKATGHLVSAEDLAMALIAEVIRPEAQDSDLARLIRRASALAKKQ